MCPIECLNVYQKGPQEVPKKCPSYHIVQIEGGIPGGQGEGERWPGMRALLPTSQLVPAAVTLDAGLHTIPHRESHIVSHQIAILFQAFLFSRSAGLELCLRDQREKLQRDKPQRDKLQDRLQQPLRRLQQPR